MSISKFEEHQVHDLFREITQERMERVRYSTWANIVFKQISHRRQVQLLRFYLFSDLHRSLSEYVLLHKDDITSTDSYQIIIAAMELIPWKSQRRWPSKYLEVLLDAGLGAFLSAEEFHSLDATLFKRMEAYMQYQGMPLMTERALQLWEKLRTEKTGVMAVTQCSQ